MGLKLLAFHGTAFKVAGASVYQPAPTESPSGIITSLSAALERTMPRTEEAEWWFYAVYGAVQEIPHGKVTSYGHIARLLGRRESRDFDVFMH